MTIKEIIGEIQYRVNRNEGVHYNNPACQKLVDQETRALKTAVRALELSTKLRAMSATEWAKTRPENR